MGFTIVLLLLLGVGVALAGQEEASVLLEGTLDGRLLISSHDGSDFHAAVNDLTLLLRLRWAGWSLFTRAAITDNTFGFLSIGADGRIGPLDMRAQSVFSPLDGPEAFRYLFWTTNWRIGDVRFGNTFFLADDPTRSFDQIAVRGAAAGLTWNGFIRFALCDAEFLTAQIRLNGLLFSCQVPAEAKLSFSRDEGFDLFELAVRRIPFWLLSGGVIETTLDVRLRFDVLGKQITPTLFTSAGAVCAGIQPYLELVADELPRIDGLDVYGISFSCSVGENVTATAATCFDAADGTRNRQVTGETEYFERLSLVGLASGCCGGGAIEWSIDTYFLKDPPVDAPFGWGRTDVLFAFPLGSAASLSIEAEFTLLDGWTFLLGVSTQF